MLERSNFVGARLTPDEFAHLDRAAVEHGLNRAEAIRQSIAIGLPYLSSGVGPDPERQVTISEFAQVALTILLDQIDEDLKYKVEAVAERRVAEHYKHISGSTKLGASAQEAAE